MAARSRKNSFLIQGSILAVTSLIVRFIGLIYRIPLNYVIGDGGQGIYSNTFEIYNLALILSSYSLPMAVSKLVAIKRENKEYINSYRIFKCAMVFSASVGLFATVIIFAGAEFFSSFYKIKNSLVLPLRVLSLTIFVFSIMGVLRGYFQGKNTMVPTAISQVLEQIVNAVVSIVAAYILVKNFSANAGVASYGAAGGTLGTLLGALTGLLFLLFVFVVYKPYLNKQLRHDTHSEIESYGSILKLLLITTIPIILSQTVYQISGTLDGIFYNNIMYSKHLSNFDITTLIKNGARSGDLYKEDYRNALYGIYSAKYKLLTNVPVAIATAIAAAIITTIAAAFSNKKMDEIRSKVHIAIKFNMIVAIPSAVGMAVLASPIQRLIYRDARALPANLLILGSSAIVFFALSTLSSAILQGINRLMTPVTNSAISLVIHIVMVILLLKYTSLSTYALVIGNVSFALVVCILNWIAINKYLDYQQEVMKSFIIPTICSGIMGVVTYFAYKVFMTVIGINLIATLFAIIVAMVVYFAFLVFLRAIDEEELSFLPKGRRIVRVLKKLHLL